MRTRTQIESNNGVNEIYYSLMWYTVVQKIYDTPIDPFFVALRVLRVAEDHIKLRQPQQLSHTAPFPTDQNFGTKLIWTAVCRQSASSTAAVELYHRDSLSVRKLHAEGPQI